MTSWDSEANNRWVYYHLHELWAGTSDYSALVAAIEDDRDEDMAEVLTRIPAWLNAHLFDKGFTPLHLAVHCDAAKCTQTLLRLGADPRVRSFGDDDFYGVTPLGMARGFERAYAQPHSRPLLRPRIAALLEPVTPRSVKLTHSQAENFDGPMWVMKRRDGKTVDVCPFEDGGKDESDDIGTYSYYFAIGREKTRQRPIGDDRTACITGGHHPGLQSNVDGELWWFLDWWIDVADIWTVAEDHRFHHRRHSGEHSAYDAMDVRVRDSPRR